MAKKQQPDIKIVVYQAKSGALELKKDIRHRTIWATQAQIADLFEIDRSVVTKHIGNILKDGGTDKKSNVQNMHIANSDKPVGIYSLDIILAVGYRANSRRAMEFRKWATKTLRQYIVEGYAINRSRINRNYEQFLDAVERVKQLLPPSRVVDTQSVLELVNTFAGTWLSLDAYDKGRLPRKGTIKKRVALTAGRLRENLIAFKTALAKKGEITEHFGLERHSGSIEGIIGNMM